jgi:hypothetical protein
VVPQGGGPCLFWGDGRFGARLRERNLFFVRNPKFPSTAAQSDGCAEDFHPRRGRADKLVARGRIELPTPRFSVACSAY